MPRLFAGLELPEPLKTQLMSLMGGINGARWLSPEQLHLTLRFIGDVDGAMAEDVVAALSGVSFSGFSCRLSGAGVFGSPLKPRAVWIGAQPVDRLKGLHQKIDYALVAAGLPPEERQFRPHVTLARFGRNARPADGFLSVHNDFSSTPFDVEEMVLFESRLGHGGASYRVVESYPAH